MDHDLYVGVEHSQYTDDPQEFLLRIWADGTHELATRPAGSSATWSPPVTLMRQSAEVSG